MSPETSLSATPAIPALVLGGNGYVAGELLRLLAAHPHFRVASALSSSHEGKRVVDAFPHLLGTAVDTLHFAPLSSIRDHLHPGQPLAIFAATPHGATAELLGPILDQAEALGAPIHIVDLSADFRFPESAERYAAIYGKSHAVPRWLPRFVSAVPEHASGQGFAHAAQPGCFTTAVTLAAYPFLALGLVEEELFVSAITGSSGSGRTPGPGTHHPERHATLHAYAPLAHRHEAEMRRLLGAACSGREPDVAFVPHSGPFVRGIHATLRMTLRTPRSAEHLLQEIRTFHAASPFVHATLEAPRLTEVIGTNRCRLGLAVRGQTLVVTSVIDNLIKGAAGGGIQWMNRLFDLPEDAGLRLAGLGWY